MLQDFLCHTPFRSINCHMVNKTDFFFVCTYTNRPLKESRHHVLYPYLYPYLYVDILWQCAISRFFSVKLTTSAPNEIKSFPTWISYLLLSCTFDLWFSWVSGMEGSPWGSSCNFLLMRAVCHLPFYAWKTLGFPEPWLSWRSWAMPHSLLLTAVRPYFHLT